MSDTLTATKFAVKLQFVINPSHDPAVDPIFMGGEPADNHWTIPHAEIENIPIEKLPLWVDICKQFNSQTEEAVHGIEAAELAIGSAAATLYMRIMDSDGRV